MADVIERIERGEYTEFQRLRDMIHRARPRPDFIILGFRTKNEVFATEEARMGFLGVHRDFETFMGIEIIFSRKETDMRLGYVEPCRERSGASGR